MSDSAARAVRVYLRAPLFTLKRDGHVPAGAVILTGTLHDTSGGGLELSVSAYAGDQGQPLDGPPRRLLVPGAKVDHVELLEA